MKQKFVRCIILNYIVASAAVHKLQVTNFCMVAPKFVGSQYGTHFISPFWHLEFLRWLRYFWKTCACLRTVGLSVFTDSKCETLNVEFVVNTVPPILAALLHVY